MSRSILTTYSATLQTPKHTSGCCLLTSAHHQPPSIPPTDIKLWTLQLPLSVDQGHPESQTPGSQSSNIIFNAGAPHGYVLRPLLLYSKDSVATHGSNAFAETTVVGLINNEAPYREEVQVQLTWCSDKLGCNHWSR